MFEETFQERTKNWHEYSELKTSGKLTTALALKNGYTYNFEWLGKKIIQFPEDIVNLQMIIYESKPDIIIETGVANGGSALFFASMLAMNEMMGCYKNPPKYIGLDINIKKTFADELKYSPFNKYIELLECDTSNPNVAEEISHLITDNERIMVVLDSCHTKKHVINEISSLSQLVTKGNHLIVCDTTVGVVGPAYDNCKYGVNYTNSPYQALEAIDSKFVLDQRYTKGQLVSSNFDGVYKKVND